MKTLTEQIDELFAQNRGKEAEALLEKSLRELLEQGKAAEAIPVLNELIGYCRETSQVEKSYEYAGFAMELLERLRLQGTLPYATTLLNIANAYRAGGRLEDSLKLYGLVEDSYRELLPEDDMLVASLYNNKSLLYQEMNRFDLAREVLWKALHIVEKKDDTAFEAAVTYANLAATDLSLNLEEEAEVCFRKAITLFEENNIFDTHYCAALSSLATYHYRRREYEEAEKLFLKAAEGIESHLGRNEYYQRMRENAEVCRQAHEEMKNAPKVQTARGEEKIEKGLEISRAYYEMYGKPMLEKLFPEDMDKIAVGLVGEGSDCFGYDDEISRDHDWGPDLCLWVTEETYARIGAALEQAYEELPKEFMGYKRQTSVQGKGRRGVRIISKFYDDLLGKNNWLEDSASIHWEEMEDTALAAAVNGKVFADPEGIFTGIRRRLREEYPDRLRYIKLAEAMAGFAQNGQYNLARMLKRGDRAAARILQGEAVREGCKILYYAESEYPPHDKWLLHGLRKKKVVKEIVDLLERAALEESEEAVKLLEQAGAGISHYLYQKNVISDTESYLDAHVGELLFKAGIVELSAEELAEKVARMEFAAFDKVKNLGGRADCQDDWFTFSIMRKSQYLTWNKTMLIQYAYDFSRELERGHNLIEEKYGRMMESTAPEEYETMKKAFPLISEQKKGIIEAIVVMQVGWMEEFAQKYPFLAGNARSIHTYEDTLWNTSYETYLRGEISTYSDKMLELYGRYIVELSQKGENPAKKIMEHSVWMYGYESLEEAEQGLASQ